MLTGDYEKDKAELERLIAHEEGVKRRLEQSMAVSNQSIWRYLGMLDALDAEHGK